MAYFTLKKGEDGQFYLVPTEDRPSDDYYSETETDIPPVMSVEEIFNLNEETK